MKPQVAEYELYKRIKLLGEGAFGKAYLVECLQDQTKWVIKYMDLNAMSKQEKEETIKEAKILELLNHPNIVKFREVYLTKKGKMCIVMEYADGGDLSKQIKDMKGKKQNFSEAQILDWFTQICLAVKHVHDRKIIHRDLKGQNIFLTSDNKIKLGDFGIAKALSATQGKAKTMVGTPYYLSPEIIESKPYSQKTDIWSLGAILYELCSLKPPFEAESLHFLALKIVRGQYAPIPSVYPQPIKSLVSSLLNLDDRRRPAISDILKQPIIVQRIRSFLTESVRNTEFSHTVLHKQNYQFNTKLEDIKQVNQELPCPPQLLPQRSSQSSQNSQDNQKQPDQKPKLDQPVKNQQPQQSILKAPVSNIPVNLPKPALNLKPPVIQPVLNQRKEPDYEQIDQQKPPIQKQQPQQVKKPPIQPQPIQKQQQYQQQQQQQQQYKPQVQQQQNIRPPSQQQQIKRQPQNEGLLVVNFSEPKPKDKPRSNSQQKILDKQQQDAKVPKKQSSRPSSNQQKIADPNQKQKEEEIRLKMLKLKQETESKRKCEEQKQKDSEKLQQIERDKKKDDLKKKREDQHRQMKDDIAKRRKQFSSNQQDQEVGEKELVQQNRNKQIKEVEQFEEYNSDKGSQEEAKSPNSFGKEETADIKVSNEEVFEDQPELSRQSPEKKLDQVNGAVLKFPEVEDYKFFEEREKILESSLPEDDPSMNREDDNEEVGCLSQKNTDIKLRELSEEEQEGFEFFSSDAAKEGLKIALEDLLGNENFENAVKILQQQIDKFPLDEIEKKNAGNGFKTLLPFLPDNKRKASIPLLFQYIIRL